jgi:ribosomal protein S18 acetylase RimI-like enzyme
MDMPRPPLSCTPEPDLDVREFRRVLIDSGLGRIRPVDDLGRLQQMLDAADVVLTARDTGGRLVGVARCITDFSWCAYLSDLAVSASAQGLGAGRALLEGLRNHLGPRVTLALQSVPTAVGFYERAGMARMADTFCLRRSH